MQLFSKKANSTMRPYIALFVLCISINALATEPKKSESVTPVPAATPSLSGSWGDGIEFENYTVFRDEMYKAITSAKKSVSVATFYFSDADLATALLTMKIRGLSIAIAIDRAGTKKFASRHDYFTQNGVPTYETRLSRKEMKGFTTIVIDGIAWRISVPLYEKSKGVVQVDHSPLTPEEIAQWISPDVAKTIAAPPAALPSAKPSTKITRTSRLVSDKITGNGTVKDRGVVPRKLPRETRFQRERRGVQINDPLIPLPGETSVGNVPSTPEREADIGEE